MCIRDSLYAIDYDHRHGSFPRLELEPQRFHRSENGRLIAAEIGNLAGIGAGEAHHGLKLTNGIFQREIVAAGKSGLIHYRPVQKLGERIHDRGDVDLPRLELVQAVAERRSASEIDRRAPSAGGHVHIDLARVRVGIGRHFFHLEAALTHHQRICRQIAGFAMHHHLEAVFQQRRHHAAKSLVAVDPCGPLGVDVEMFAAQPVGPDDLVILHVIRHVEVIEERKVSATHHGAIDMHSDGNPPIGKRL